MERSRDIHLQTRDADMIQIEKWSEKATIYNIVHTFWLIQGRLMFMSEIRITILSFSAKKT